MKLARSAESPHIVPRKARAGECLANPARAERQQPYQVFIRVVLVFHLTHIDEALTGLAITRHFHTFQRATNSFSVSQAGTLLTTS